MNACSIGWTEIFGIPNLIEFANTIFCAIKSLLINGGKTKPYVGLKSKLDSCHLRKGISKKLNQSILWKAYRILSCVLCTHLVFEKFLHLLTTLWCVHSFPLSGTVQLGTIRSSPVWVLRFQENVFLHQLASGTSENHDAIKHNKLLKTTAQGCFSVLSLHNFSAVFMSGLSAAKSKIFTVLLS